MGLCDPANLALAAVLAMAPDVPMPKVTSPPPQFCEVHPDQCHPLGGPRRAHFLGMLRQAVRALPKVPGYRCQSEGREIGVVGFGPTARESAPEDMSETIWCYGRGTDPRKRYPDVTISVELSMLAASVPEGGTRDKKHDLLVFTRPEGVDFMFGKIREWRDPSGLVHRGHDPLIPTGASLGRFAQDEVVRNGPYLVSASVSFDAESPEALDAFVRGFNRGAVSALMAREDARRKADRQAGPIAGALQ